MKKRDLKSLKLNKKSVSNFNSIKGGLFSVRCSYAESCIWHGCYSDDPDPLPF